MKTRVLSLLTLCGLFAIAGCGQSPDRPEVSGGPIGANPSPSIGQTLDLEQLQNSALELSGLENQLGVLVAESIEQARVGQITSAEVVRSWKPKLLVSIRCQHQPLQCGRLERN